MEKRTNFRFLKCFIAVFLLIFNIFAFSACSSEPAEAPTISISSDGYWVINGEKTDTKATGNDCADGTDGKDGTDGSDGKDGESQFGISLKEAYLTLKEIDGYTGSFSDFLEEYLKNSLDLSANVSTEARKSIVSITRKNSTKKGSGVIIKKDESQNIYVLTNYHVCYPSAQTDDFYLCLADDDNKQNTFTASYVAGDEQIDLAILKVENFSQMSNIKLANIATTNAFDGTTCLAIGNANSKGIAVSLGTVSKDLEKVSYNAGTGAKEHDVLRHCAFIAKGSSGGGLFNLRGELIGITCAGEGDDQTLMNYAVPIEIVNEFIDEIFNN